MFNYLINGTEKIINGTTLFLGYLSPLFFSIYVDGPYDYKYNMLPTRSMYLRLREILYELFYWYQNSILLHKSFGRIDDRWPKVGKCKIMWCVSNGTTIFWYYAQVAPFIREW